MHIKYVPIMKFCYVIYFVVKGKYIYLFPQAIKNEVKWISFAVKMFNFVFGRHR